MFSSRETATQSRVIEYGKAASTLGDFLDTAGVALGSSMDIVILGVV